MRAKSFDDIMKETFEDGLEEGAEREREAIVEWLQFTPRVNSMRSSYQFARDIEDGKHNE